MEILLVDDNEINMEIQKMMIESNGITVKTASNGADAVKMAEEQDFFMIFMDIHMPEMDGYEASKLIRKFNKSVPIVALTADEFSEVQQKLNENGIDAYLSKPIQPEELQELLQKHLNIHTISSENKMSDKYFDYDSLYAVFNDAEAVQRLIKQFLSAHENDCELLGKYIFSGKYLPAREILHNIIGISGNLFCRKLYNISCRVSSELKKDYPDSFDTFEEIWDKTIAELKACLVQETTRAVPVRESFRELWEEFFELCTEFDISAVDIFTENKQIFSGNMENKTFSQLEKAVMKYDFLWISENMEGLYV
ncbi:MAG: response regulator [Ruminococcus sp.]|nr:response regulator [Ruminococcus sp.]MDE6796922.1 response regulator [Ruminococcus sp.]